MLNPFGFLAASDLFTKTRLKVNPKLLANSFFKDHIILKIMFVNERTRIQEEQFRE